ncbi:MAG: hypothetical protein JXA82_16875 [Sedimentisphaerales bacterium]|nr:hypothetical protein [Sedimentisphaerales bacterium]
MAGFLLAVSLLGILSRWDNPERWHQLQKQMTKADVMRLLGRPLDMEIRNGSEIWYYQEIPQREGKLVINRPENGMVRFSSSPVSARSRRPVTSVLLVHSWIEPDWSLVDSSDRETENIQPEENLSSRQLLIREQQGTLYNSEPQNQPVLSSPQLQKADRNHTEGPVPSTTFAPVAPSSLLTIILVVGALLLGFILGRVGS